MFSLCQCVCACQTAVFFSRVEALYFRLPVGFYMPACVQLDARESDVVGPTWNVKTIQKIHSRSKLYFYVFYQNILDFHSLFFLGHFVI